MHTTTPRVTLVMTARERHGLAPLSIASVLAATDAPFRFLYLDVQSPPWLRRELDAQAARGVLECIRFDEPLWPNEARARVIDRLDTEFVFFLDNDVVLEPGWLAPLLACADETGAGIVGPLYLWGGSDAAPRIHMAGGRLTETPVGDRRVLEEAHRRFDEDYRPDDPALRREPCGFVEFHGMLVRTALLRAGLLDPAMRCVHEHIDLALAARAAGHEVWFEPASKLTYLAFADYRLDDLPLLRRRWAPEAAEADLARFAARWRVVDDARSFGGVRGFVRSHLGDVDPLRGEGFCGDRAEPMPRSALAQTRSDLLDLAQARGYEAQDLGLLAHAWQLAQAMMDGGYRPCGRPFVNHLAGTASVLAFYGFRTEVVAAGLLHALYTHCPEHPRGRAAAAQAIAQGMGGAGSPVESRVRAYTLRDAQGPQGTIPRLLADPESATVPDAEVLAIVAANELEMHLSGEFRYCGRADAIAPSTAGLVESVCERLGVPGLAAALREQSPRAAPPALRASMQASYRISADKQRALPMVNNVLA